MGNCATGPAGQWVDARLDEDLLQRMYKTRRFLPDSVETVTVKGELSDDGLRIVAVLLLGSKNSARRLCLNRKSLGDRGADVLATALGLNGTLSRLSLEGNNIGDAGAEALAGALVTNQTLTRLDLRSNWISDGGAAAVALALCENESIEELDLGCNAITDDGAVALAKVLPRTDSLRVLQLTANRIGLRGVRAVIQALCLNQRIVNLGVSQGKNMCGLEGLRYVYGALGKRIENECYTNRFDINDIFCGSSVRWMGLGCLAAISERMEATLAAEALVAVLPLYHLRLRRSGQSALLKVTLERGIRLIAEDMESADYRLLPSMVGRVASTIGVKGIFSILRSRPALISNK